MLDADLINQYRELHRNNENYGASSIENLEEICLFIDYLKPSIVLDYGCGKGLLLNELKKLYPNIKFYGYDPAIPEIDIIPVEYADLVVNTDVLEHIPEALLPDTIKKISEISQNVFFNLHHGFAAQKLSDDSNAHCTVQPPSFYHNLFSKFFKNIMALKGRTHLHTVVITFEMHPDIVWKYYEIIQRDTLNQMNYILNTLPELKKEIESIRLKSVKLHDLKIFPKWFCKLICFFKFSKKERELFRETFME